MTEKMKRLLLQALEKYGEDEYIVQKSEIQKYFEKGSAYQNIALQKQKYGAARAVFGIYGRILEENEDKNQYVFITRASKRFDNEALFVSDYEGETLRIAAYAKEGLFFQGIAKKEIGRLLKEIGN